MAEFLADDKCYVAVHLNPGLWRPCQSPRPGAKGKVMIRALVHNRQKMALALMVLVLAMRVLVPAGFMPMVASHGLTITMCTPKGAVDIIVDVHGKAPASSHQDADDHCIFASTLGGAALLAMEPLLALTMPPLAALAEGAAIADLTPHRLAAPPPPAIGPPAFIQA
jgi:hypothetical protein